MGNPIVSIIMGSDSDLPVMKAAAEILEILNVSYEITIVSAHRTPERMYNFARHAADRGIKVIIAGAGGAAHLPGMIASITHLPVIGVPIKSKALNGIDSLYSIVQMPSGVPVATVSINGATNAGILAAQIIATSDKELKNSLINYKKDLLNTVEEKAKALEDKGYENYNDKLGEECGVIGIYDNNGLKSSNSLFYGLYSLQHRGQEGAGITSTDGQGVYAYKKSGLVLDIFKEEVLEELKGHISIGHTRYGRDGQGNSHENLQPMVAKKKEEYIALAHNGSLVNGKEIKEILENEGEVFKSTIDAEVILKLISKYKESNILTSIEKTMDLIDGAYALVIMTEKELIGIRDPYGLRPLCLGKVEGSYVLASESCALTGMGAEFIRDIKPGEIITINGDGIKSSQYNKKQKRASCVFEYVYFARPDSIIDGANVYETRKNAGKILAREYPVDADMVIAVPDSAVPVALGYAEELGLTFGEGLFKNRYVGRTFIEPDQKSRERTLKLKLTTLTQNVKGKKILLVDDSIVRGTTSKKIVAQLKEAGAKEVHLRISSPPVSYSCYYGIDTPDPKELLGANKSVEEIGQLIGADSLRYISLDGLLESTGLAKENFCTACFSGEYPIT